MEIKSHKKTTEFLKAIIIIIITVVIIIYNV